MKDKIILIGGQGAGLQAALEQLNKMDIEVIHSNMAEEPVEKVFPILPYFEEPYFTPPLTRRERRAKERKKK